MFAKKAITNAVLVQKKNKILNVFTQMQDELKELKEEQQRYANDLKEQLKELNAELSLVETTKEETIKTINNIDKILK